jgi:predicted ATPase
MIKLERIYVKNYKNIAEADLELGNMNVIVGENGSGKSNLLGVIPLLNYIINGSANDVENGFLRGGIFDFRQGSIAPSNKRIDEIIPIKFLLEFFNTVTNHTYCYELQIERYVVRKPLNDLMEEFEIKAKIAYESFTYKLKTQTGKPISIINREDTTIKFGDGIKKSDTITYLNNNISAIRYLHIIKNSESVSDDYKIALGGLNEILNTNIYYLSSQVLKGVEINSLNENRIIGFDLIQEIFLYQKSNYWLTYQSYLKTVLGISDIKLAVFKLDESLPEFKRFNFTQNNIRKSIRELSDGTLVLLALITKIFSDSSDIFFIEEPENSIHPKALYELMKLIRERSADKQFIITTHSPYLLNMIKPEEVLVAEIGDNGLSTISKLPDVKAIRRRLAKNFMSFGDIIFAQPENEDGEEKVY